MPKFQLLELSLAKSGEPQYLNLSSHLSQSKSYLLDADCWPHRATLRYQETMAAQNDNRSANTLDDRQSTIKRKDDMNRRPSQKAWSSCSRTLVASSNEANPSSSTTYAATSGHQLSESPSNYVAGSKYTSETGHTKPISTLHDFCNMGLNPALELKPYPTEFTIEPK